MTQSRTYFGEIPQDINWMILHQTEPESLVSLCLGDPNVTSICQSDRFRESYTNHWSDYLLDKYKNNIDKGLEISALIGSWPLITQFLNIKPSKSYIDLSNILVGFIKGYH